MSCKIVFRVDDVTSTMHWENFERFVDICQQFQLKPLLGIVPENKDPKLDVCPENTAFWARMRELKQQGWSIAQHGYQHVYCTADSGLLGINNRSEFAGLSYEAQFEKIQKGQEILRKQELGATIWMAPAHSYDSLTLKALVDLGFDYVTDGYALAPYRYKKLVFIPCQTSSFPKNIPGVYTVCLHLNHVDDGFFDRLRTFLENNHQRCFPFSSLLTQPAPVRFSLASRLIEKGVLGVRKLKRMRF